MPIDALSVSCAQLTRDLLAVVKFLFITEDSHMTWDPTENSMMVRCAAVLMWRLKGSRHISTKRLFSAIHG